MTTQPQTKMTQCEADEMEARTKRIHGALMTEGAQKIAELRAENTQLREVLAGAQELRHRLLATLQYVPECVLDFCNEVRSVLRQQGGGK